MTKPVELWDNPMLSMDERLQIAIGAVDFWKKCHAQKIQQLEAAKSEIKSVMAAGKAEHEKWRASLIERDSLKQQLEAAKQFKLTLIDSYEQQIAELKDKLAQCEADARRYRWMERYDKLDGWTREVIDRDLAIEAAIAAEGAGEEG